jgi:peptide deformylase
VIKHPRTSEEWAEVIQETTIKLCGAGNLLSTTLPIRVYPDPILSEISEPVREDEFGTDKLALLCEKMHVTTFYNNGVGLSAVQIGELKRVITMKIPEVDKYDVSRPYNLINPEIIQADGTFKFQEGCLSVPGYYEDRKRANRIVLRFRTIHGVQMEEEFTDLEAFCIQHEMDHLDGKLFIDELSPLKKRRVRAKVQKTMRRNK